MSKKTNVFIVWGYGSGPESTLVKSLQKILPKNKYNVISDFYAQYDPNEALTDLNNYIKDYNVDIIVGSSLGAFLTMQIDTTLPKILINPCVRPDIELPLLMQDVEKLDSNGEKVLDDNGNPVMEKVPTVPQHIVDNYTKYVNSHNIFENISKNDLNVGIFGTMDELLGDRYVQIIQEHIDIIEAEGMGHHNTFESTKNFVAPEIINIIEGSND